MKFNFEFSITRKEGLSPESLDTLAKNSVKQFTMLSFFFI